MYGTFDPSDVDLFWGSTSRGPAPGHDARGRYLQWRGRLVACPATVEQDPLPENPQEEDPVLVDGLYPVHLKDVLDRGEVKVYDHDIPQSVVDACAKYGVRIDRTGLRFGDYLLIAPETPVEPAPVVEQAPVEPAPVEPAPVVEQAPLNFGGLFGGAVKVKKRRR